ncbi:hypothetical protein ACKVMT_01805 [Halobacteriales archaeon Cl-PHB]
METDQLKELVPHYIALFILVFGILAVVRAVVGDIGFWAEMAFVVVIVFVYRPIVVRLGVGPSGWE